MSYNTPLGKGHLPLEGLHRRLVVDRGLGGALQPGEIEIGSKSVISQCCYICTGGHDYTKPGFDIYTRKIAIGDEAWVATGTFVAPGVSIGRGAVVGAGSGVFSNLSPMTVCYENPVSIRRKRETG